MAASLSWAAEVGSSSSKISRMFFMLWPVVPECFLQIHQSRLRLAFPGKFRVRAVPAQSIAWPLLLPDIQGLCFLLFRISLATSDVPTMAAQALGLIAAAVSAGRGIQFPAGCRARQGKATCAIRDLRPEILLPGWARGRRVRQE